MQQLVSQVVLPLVLATIMLGMGLALTGADFKRVFLQPKAAVLGIALQMLYLPVLALIAISLVPLSPVAQAGLFLLALCPGGATSNLFSFVARGDLALSVTLTGVVSVVTPFTLPVLLLAYLQWAGLPGEAFDLPVLDATRQIAMVTLLPMLTGMLTRKHFARFAVAAEPVVRRLAAVAMFTVVVALLAVNPAVSTQAFSYAGLATLILSSMSLVSAYWVGARFLPDLAQVRSIAIEVGVQNAGTAMMVALTIMHQPELALVPLMYGILMNIPTFAFVAWARQKEKLVTDT